MTSFRRQGCFILTKKGARGDLALIVKPQSVTAFELKLTPMGNREMMRVQASSSLFMHDLRAMILISVLVYADLLGYAVFN